MNHDETDTWVDRDLTVHGNGWETPEPIDAIDAMPLPESAGRLPAALWGMVDASAEALQVPRDLGFLLSLSILSACSGGRREARINSDWVEPLPIYTVVSLPPGTRKSAAHKTMMSPLHEVQDELREATAMDREQQLARRDVLTAKVEKLKKTGDDSHSALADLDSAIQDLAAIEVPARPKLVGDDVTPEHLGHTMADQGGRFSLFSAEGGLFATLGGRYSSGVPNLDLVLKSWSGDYWDSGRVSRGDLTISNPFLAIGLSVQPEILEGLAETRQLRYSGFLGRFFYGVPRSLVGTRKAESTPIPHDVREAYRLAIKDFAHTVWPSKVAELPLTEGAVKVLNDYQDQHEPRLHPEFGDLADIADWAAKLPGQLVRIAALLALFDHPSIDAIDETWMRQAIDLGPYLISHARGAFDLMSGRFSRANHPRMVLTWIRRKKLTDFTIRQARRDLGGQEWAQDVEAIRSAIAELEELGWVRQRQQPAPPAGRAGRPPSERYDVNPATHTRRSVNSVNASGDLQEAS